MCRRLSIARRGSDPEEEGNPPPKNHAATRAAIAGEKGWTPVDEMVDGGRRGVCIGTIAKPIIMFRGKEHRRPLLRGTLAKKKSGSGSVRSLPRRSGGAVCADRLDIRRLVWKFVEKTESIESSLRGPLPRPGTLSRRKGLSCQQDQIVSSVEAWCTKTIV